MSTSVRQTLPDVREWLGGPPGSLGGSHGFLGVVGEPSRTFGRAFRTFPDIREGLPPLLDIRQCLSTTPGHSGGPPPTPRHPEWPPELPGGPPNHSQPSVSVSRPLSDIREGLPTTPGHPTRLPTTPRHLGGPPHHSLKFGITFRPLPDIQQDSRTYGRDSDYSWSTGRDS